MECAIGPRLDQLLELERKLCCALGLASRIRQPVHLWSTDELQGTETRSEKWRLSSPPGGAKRHRAFARTNRASRIAKAVRFEHGHTQDFGRVIDRRVFVAPPLGIGYWA